MFFVNRHLHRPLLYAVLWSICALTLTKQDNKFCNKQRVEYACSTLPINSLLFILKNVTVKHIIENEQIDRITKLCWMTNDIHCILCVYRGNVTDQQILCHGKAQTEWQNHLYPAGTQAQLRIIDYGRISIKHVPVSKCLNRPLLSGALFLHNARVVAEQ